MTLSIIAEGTYKDETEQNKITGWELYEKGETNTLITKLLEKDENYFPVIKEIIEKRLGMGKLLRDATRIQTEQVNMILFDLKEYISEHNITLD